MQLPFYVLANAEWIESQESRGTKGCNDLTMDTAMAGDKRCAMLFTSLEEVGNHLKKKPGSTQRPYPLDTPNECAQLLERIAGAGIRDIVIDIGSTIPGVYPIDYVLQQVREARLEKPDGD